MTTKLIDGKNVAEKVYRELESDIRILKAANIQPGLAVVVVGENPASLTYVRNKAARCEALGLSSFKTELPVETKEEELLALIENLNNDPAVHGILVQSPLPPHICEDRIIRAIDPSKDVDGFHPVNVAKLALGDPTGFVPCTPLSCQRLLVEAGVQISGAHVAIIGRSMIVGKSLALLLMQKGREANATVTVLHSGSHDIAKISRQADVVVAAMGRARYIGVEHIGEGAVVIDVGINRVSDSSHPKGWRLVGDVDFDAVRDRCSAITPVPGGVGPMTIAMLMQNTVTAALRASGISMNP